MDTTQIVTIATGIIEGGGIGVFLYYLLRGLKQQISTLNNTVIQQNKTLEVMEKRILETEKIGDIYKKMVRELPDDIDKYKTVLTQLKNATIGELEKAIQSKDEKLESMSQLKLQELEMQERLMSELPRLREEFIETITALNTHFQSMSLQRTFGTRQMPGVYSPDELPYQFVPGSWQPNLFWNKYNFQVEPLVPAEVSFGLNGHKILKETKEQTGDLEKES